MVERQFIYDHAMDMATALEWATKRTDGILITLRRDGRAQSSDITYAYTDGTFVISLTDSRAKTANMRRDNRVVLHITDRSAWSYVAFDGTVELMPVATDPSDATTDALVAYYTLVAGEHDNWDEYRRAMVNDGRLIARFTPTSVVGQIN